MILKDINKKLILFNKLGSTQQIKKSEIGPSFSEVGTVTYETGKFGKGVSELAGSNYLISNASTEIPTDVFCFSFYWTPDLAYDTVDTKIARLFSIGTASNNYIRILKYNNGSGAANKEWGIDVISASSSNCQYTFTSSAYSAGQKILVSGILNSGASATQRLRVFIDNSELTVATSPADNAWTLAGTMQAMVGKVWNNTAAEESYGPVDTLKIYNYIKTDFSEDVVLEYPTKINGTNIYADPINRLIFFNFLNNLQSVEKSVIGSNLTENGTITYATGLWGNGVDTVYASANYPSMTWDTALMPTDNFTVECTFTPDINSSSAPANGGSLFYFGDGASNNNFMRMVWSTSESSLGGAAGWQIGVRHGATWYCIYAFNDTFTAGDNIHYRLVFNNSGGTGNRIKLYKDGSEITAYPRAPYDASWGTFTAGVYTFLIGKIGNGLTASESSGAVESYRIYNYIKTDSNDRALQYPIKLLSTNFYNTPLEQHLLWNTLSSATEVTNSRIGANGVATGGTYDTAKFGTGFRSDANSEYVTFSNVITPIADKGCIEVWIYPVATFDDGSTDRYIFSSVGADLYLFYDASANQWNFTIGGQSATYNSSSVPDSTAVHIACSWDNSASNKIRIFVDGTEGTASASAFTTPDDTNLRVGNNNSNNAFASATLSNLKLLTYQETSFPFREIQEPIDLQKVVQL